MLFPRLKTVLLDLLASPFFLAIPLALVIIFFLPITSSKYEARLLHSELVNKPNYHVVFVDLNHDGKSEQLIFFHNFINKEASVKILTHAGINYDQWNFNGYFQLEPKQFFWADLDGDGYPEVYVFYYHNDSVFLGAFQPYPDKRWLFKKMLISKVWTRDGKIDYSIPNIKAVDMDGDGYKDLVFALLAGYSRQPRSIFIFNLRKNTLISSSSIGINLSDIVITKMDEDSLPEIYCGSDTPGNINGTMHIPYDDYNSWFTGFSHHLRFLFPPIENKGYPSSVSVMPFVNNNGKRFIVALFSNTTTGLLKVRFYTKGSRLYSEKVFHFTSGQMNKIVMGNLYGERLFRDESYLLVFKYSNYFLFINEKLKIKKIKVDKELSGLLFSGDLDGKGKKEYIFLSTDNKKIIITDDHFANEVKFPIHFKNIYTFFSAFSYGILKNGYAKNELYLSYDGRVYFYSYGFNPFYYLKYPLWLLVYGMVAFVLWFAQRMHRVQLLRKQQIEETITGLQMKTLKNQLDPHFMFNVLNGLATNVAMGNKEETYDQIVRFSQLLRGLLLKADNIDTSLKEELDFVKDYLELEKFRFKKDFEYHISKDEHVNIEQRLPQMLIQLLVENAIKHGLRNKVGLKKVNIRLYSKDGNTIIEVTDNGIGRKAAALRRPRPGKGLKLLRDLIRLHRKTGGKEISIQYTDLHDDNGRPAGTVVKVVLMG
ncbi:MAG: hypothetical protein GXO86_09415 [Chlorobi bacterium]|nr:hypothetical protein [Chlorobiota bacterium]